MIPLDGYQTAVIITFIVSVGTIFLIMQADKMRKIILVVAYLLLLAVNFALIYDRVRWDCESWPPHIYKYCKARW
jgi:hypothetical protein